MCKFSKNRFLGDKVPYQRKLKLYGLYKTITVGENNTAQPWSVQLEDEQNGMLVKL